MPVSLTARCMGLRTVPTARWQPRSFALTPAPHLAHAAAFSSWQPAARMRVE